MGAFLFPFFPRFATAKLPLRLKPAYHGSWTAGEPVPFGEVQERRRR
jgi:hypothetical protein